MSTHRAPMPSQGEARRPATTREPVNASALIRNDEGQYLLHLRDHLPGLIREPGAWSLLGGCRQPQDQSLEETVRREPREEAGLDIAVLEPLAIEEARGSDGETVPIAVYAGRWNGEPADLALTEGVMLHRFTPDVFPRPRISPSTLALVRRHAVGGTEPACGDTSPQAEPFASGEPPGARQMHRLGLVAPRRASRAGRALHPGSHRRHPSGTPLHRAGLVMTAQPTPGAGRTGLHKGTLPRRAPGTQTGAAPETAAARAATAGRLEATGALGPGLVREDLRALPREVHPTRGEV
ncbi:NUDIX hydrolase [Streptomyces sp. NBC_01775]|uniref:NUDIX hydrolase n=1 Tax=Streptomyces sp. NBC_01775 TaxID=2975939 RepID=UPI002DDBD201|nr:NUDIX hydrolase [Streptomyces sp. NBC_01775]WSB74994.1 NUDIX hydrolase [Streptomyces sp. NBC_01775]